MTEIVRTRYAPSPTGFTHVGGVRTALFAWLVAKQAKGQFILRIEDTDRARHTPEAEEHLMESLRWLGLDWDAGPDKAGSDGPYRQSERLEVYQKWAIKLIESGRAYADPYSTSDLEKLRQTAKEKKQPFLYRNSRPAETPEWQPGTPLRFKSEPKSYEWNDGVLGKLNSRPEAIDDFILIKSDGYPTYNFAHIVDDQEMKISHVIRSQEFLPSIPKFLNLYEALGISRPLLATLPYVMAENGQKKLSKRDGAKDVLDYRTEGYLPDALINFLASLGWNDGTEQEIFSREELLAKFDLSRVQKSGAHFDELRLNWMNGHYIRELPVSELWPKAQNFMPAEAKASTEDYKKAVLGLIQERLKFMAELPKLSRFFFVKPDPQKILKLYKEPVDKKLVGKSASEIAGLLGASASSLAASDFSVSEISARLNELVLKLGSSPGELFSAIRIAISGEKSTPAIFDTLSTLGKEESLERLDRAVELLNQQA